MQGQDWVSQLRWILLGLRVVPKEKANISLAEMVYATALMLPGEFLDTPEAEVERWVEKLRSEAASFSPPMTATGPVMEAAEVPHQLQSCQHLYVRGDGAQPPLAAKYDGLFLMVAKAAKYCKIQKGNRVESVSVDRLKPHLGTGPVAPASPPARGRPRKAAQKDEDVLQD